MVKMLDQVLEGQIQDSSQSYCYENKMKRDPFISYWSKGGKHRVFCDKDFLFQTSYINILLRTNETSSVKRVVKSILLIIPIQYLEGKTAKEKPYTDSIIESKIYVAK